MLSKLFILSRELVSQTIRPLYVTELNQLLGDVDIILLWIYLVILCTAMWFLPVLDFSLVFGKSKKFTAPRVLYRFCITEWDFIELFNTHLCIYTGVFRNNISDNSTYVVSVPNRCGIKPRNFVLITSNQVEESKFWRSKAEFWNSQQLSINQVC